MEFLSSVNSNNRNLSFTNKLDFCPQYCHQQGFIWNKLLKLAIKSTTNNMSSLVFLPVEIMVLVSSFSLGINVGEYQYYLNSLDSKIRNLRLYAHRGNRQGFNQENERIVKCLSSLESKIGPDLQATGLETYVKNQIKLIHVCPLNEKAYIQVRLDSYLERTQNYADSGNERMMIFLKKTAKVFIDENIPSAIKLLDKISIEKDKQEYFLNSEFKNNLQKATYYAKRGDRISMNYHTRKMLWSNEINNLTINNDVEKIQDLCTPKLEKEFLISGLFRNLGYALERSKIKDQDGMKRYLKQAGNYHLKLLNLPIEIDHIEDMENYKKNILNIFNCPL